MFLNYYQKKIPLKETLSISCHLTALLRIFTLWVMRVRGWVLYCHKKHNINLFVILFPFIFFFLWPLSLKWPEKNLVKLLWLWHIPLNCIVCQGCALIAVNLWRAMLVTSVFEDYYVVNGMKSGLKAMIYYNMEDVPNIAQNKNISLRLIRLQFIEVNCWISDVISQKIKIKI